MSRATSSAQFARAGSRDDQPIVAAQALTKVFKDFWMRSRARAVDNVTFEVRRGEIFGLLGPNGSGKSTTIKLMLGLLRKTSGRLVVFGKLPSDVAVKKRIGYLPEESYLYPFLNARETLDYYAKLFELDAKVRKRRIDELLEMVGLDAVQHRQVREYSKGMQRRIGIAQALINDPEFLILDEPTTGLDPIGARQIKDLILELGARGKTVLLSSHQLSDVEDCVHRMVILYGGKIRAEGTCDDLLTANSRTIIETDALDDQTIAEIDRVLRERDRGAISRVSKPRQRLEELFLDIVERARADRIETSGAKHGGATAAFLRAEDADEGEALIHRLIRGEEPPAPEAALPPTDERTQKPDAEQPEAGPDSGVIGDLLDADEPTPDAARPGPRPGADVPKPPKEKDVDRSVIDALTEENDGRDQDGGRK